MAVEFLRRRDERGRASVGQVGEVDDLHPGPRRDDQLLLHRGGIDQDVESLRGRRPSRVTPASDEHLAAGVLECRSDGLRGPAGAEHEHAPALGLDLRGHREPVGGGAEHAAVLDHECVDGARPPGDFVDLVAEPDHRLLVRDRDIRPREPRGDEPAHGIGERLGRRRQRDVRPVEPDRSERDVLHPGRERMRRRPAEKADEGRRATDFDHAVTGRVGPSGYVSTIRRPAGIARVSTDEPTAAGAASR